MIEHPIFGPKLDNWLRTLAKKNTFLIMATQSLDEIVKSEIFTSIVTNIPNKIFLPNKDAGAYEDMYINCFQLNHAQVERIKRAERKRDYYFTSGDISRMVQARFPKEIMAATRSDTLAQDVFDKFYSQRDLNPSWDRDYVSALCK